MREEAGRPGDSAAHHFEHLRRAVGGGEFGRCARLCRAVPGLGPDDDGGGEIDETPLGGSGALRADDDAHCVRRFEVLRGEIEPEMK